MTSLFYCLMPCMLNTFLSHIWPAFTVPPVSKSHCRLSSAASPFTQARTHQICTAVCRSLPLHSHRHAHIKFALMSGVSCHSIHTGTHTSNLQCRLSSAACSLMQASCWISHQLYRRANKFRTNCLLNRFLFDHMCLSWSVRTCSAGSILIYIIYALQSVNDRQTFHTL